MAAGLSCPPLDDYCSSRPCVRSLSDWCAPDGGGSASNAQLATCDGYRVVDFNFGDSGTQYYYDAISGALVAVVSEVANSIGVQRCDGGPATFTLPQHCQPETPLCGG